ncbi:hypothetical protein [Moritella viscosa]|uniref:hypothetical protein n=1 Tax=Moritella viscosa TaxID=80854 RepID=UPI00094C3E6A|nr:hypothetical protein [Moritella viscosa]
MPDNTVLTDLLNLCASIIAIIGAANFVCRKVLDQYKQKLATLNKRIKLQRIRKLRRQYFIMQSIESDLHMLISYSVRNIGSVLIMLMMMSFIGFIFLYLDHGILKFSGGFYILLILVLTLHYFDECADVLLGLKSPKEYKKKIKSNLAELRVKS